MHCQYDYTPPTEGKMVTACRKFFIANIGWSKFEDFYMYMLCLVMFISQCSAPVRSALPVFPFYATVGLRIRLSSRGRENINCTRIGVESETFDIKEKINLVDPVGIGTPISPTLKYQTIRDLRPCLRYPLVRAGHMCRRAISRVAGTPLIPHLALDVLVYLKTLACVSYRLLFRDTTRVEVVIGTPWVRPISSHLLYHLVENEKGKGGWGRWLDYLLGRLGLESGLGSPLLTKIATIAPLVAYVDGLLSLHYIIAVLLFSADIRVQLTEQLRCLDVRMESQVALVAELQDYFRRRAEVELDYSKNLDKLAKSLQLRHKEQRQKLELLARADEIIRLELRKEVSRYFTGTFCVFSYAHIAYMRTCPLPLGPLVTVSRLTNHVRLYDRREQWPLFSSYSCWQQLVTQTKNLSRDHAALSEVYSTHLVGRLAQVMEDVQRIYRRCREIGYETHEEILRVLHELHTTMKTYHSYQGEYKQAETKLRVAENQRLKLEQSLAREKLDRSKKYKLIEKEVQKRKNKYNDAKLKALKARNEYMLCLEASNSTIHKYFVEDLSDLIDCMDFGFHNCVSRALLMHVSAEEGAMKSAQAGLDQMTNCVGSLDSRLDKQRFLEFNHTAFMIPKKFEFQGQKDEVSSFGTGNTVTRNFPIKIGLNGPETELQKSLRDELESRLSQLHSRVMSLRTESEEVWKTLETAETTLLDMLNAKDYDCSMYFGDTALPSNKPPETVSIKLRADRQETEEFYLTKFREYILGTSRIARLDAKHEFIRLTLLDAAGDSPTSLKGLHRTGQVAKPPRRKRIGRLQMNGQPKLFGGSLEEYLEATNQEIPLIMKSCIRVINLYGELVNGSSVMVSRGCKKISAQPLVFSYKEVCVLQQQILVEHGLHHQGIFRVSGSQVEINNFRESFERGEDPLADMTDASDINSVGGVLKLYLRELREPLFPIIYFEHFMELAQLESKQDFVVKMKDLVQSLSRSVVVVMRYLFAFLNHLSEFSDENMMDPYNLAICFGPTLVPVPEDKDQVQYQNQVNELIKNIILFYEEIFPFDGGLMYEKYISGEPDETDVGDSPSDHVQEDGDSEVYPSEDESEFHEATAQFDFSARSERELSFKKGDNIILFSQVSNDWWKGSLNEQEGLVPDKYIMLKIKDEERDKLELLKSSSSEESMRRRASSSNDSILSSNTSSSAHNSPVTNVASATWPDPELTRRSLVAEPSPLIAVPTQEIFLSLHLFLSVSPIVQIHDPSSGLTSTKGALVQSLLIGKECLLKVDLGNELKFSEHIKLSSPNPSLKFLHLQTPRAAFPKSGSSSTFASSPDCKPHTLGCSVFTEWSVINLKENKINLAGGMRGYFPGGSNAIAALNPHLPPFLSSAPTS
uniref:SLIT-ROBO Rho GTPase-activating protein 1 n=1 Tax=Timema genevievae TaxID=629358 RepID=A0A7R9PJH7_TIMGE|nr:unnamed protein product [Timema genevievae]